MAQTATNVPVNLVGKSLDIYALKSELGRGGMGAVYLAESTADGPAGPAGSVVAVKVFHSHLVEDERALERFEREAEVGRSIRHPHVVHTFDLGKAEVEGATWHYMAMEFIEGQTLEELRTELGTLPDHLLYQVADQALDGLQAIHEHGIIHRDIKPENIVITAEYRVLLMDLGVARLLEHGRTLTQAGEFVGSLPYAAPEQFEAAGGLTPACDLYSFGVVLYELATGKNPFDAEDIGTLLQQKLQGEVERPKLRHPDLDVFWDEVIATCVERPSANRFSSAEELRTILQEGKRSEWWRLRSEGLVLPGAEYALERLRIVRRSPLVGRDGELAGLREFYQSVQSGEGRVLLVGGGAGVGKSRLVYEFVEQLSSASGPLVLAGRAVGAGGRAYQPFLEAIHDLLAIDELELEGRRGKLEAKLAELLPDTPGVVPFLAEFLLAGLSPDDAKGFTKDALLSSIVSILRRTAADRTLVVVVEDLHLAESDTLDLFGYLARCLPEHRILLLGVYDDEQVEEGSDLHALVTGSTPRGEAAMLSVRPLSRSASDQLVSAIVVNESTVRAIGSLLHEKSDGNPYTVLEVLEHLHSSGALVEENGGLALAGPVDRIEFPSTVTDLMALKLARLDEEQRETLEAAAILGPEFEAMLLAAVLEDRRIKLLKRLAILERKHGLIESSGKDSFRFAKRQFQEAIYQSIGPALQGEYHSIVAEAIREKYVDDAEGEIEGKTAFSLVNHLLQAERALEGEPFLEVALDHLARTYHASFAVPFLERLAAQFQVGRAPACFAIAMGCWTFYEMLGRGEDQRRVLEKAQGCAEEMDDKGKLGQVHSCLAVTFWRTGQPDRASEEARSGLTLAREAGDRTWESNSLHTLGAVEYQRANFQQCADHWNESLAIRREIGDRRGEASSLQALGAVMPLLGRSLDEVLATKLASLQIFREIGDRRGECALLNNVAIAYNEAGQPKEALERCERAAEISRELGDLQSEAYPLCNAGRALEALGRIEDARSSLERALSLFEELGNRSGELAAITLLAPTLAKLGEYGPAVHRLTRAINLATETGAKDRLVHALREMGDTLHRMGDRELGWAQFDLALEAASSLENPAGYAQTVLVMSAAALRERDFTRAIQLLEEVCLSESKVTISGEARALALSRLARACHAVGQCEEAGEYASEVRAMLDEIESLSRQHGPEIYYNLRVVTPDGDLARRYLTTASEMIKTLGRSIRDDGQREHFLREAWPNCEILGDAPEAGQ